MTKEKVGREPIEIVEIDQDFCALEYGTTNSEGTCNALLSVDKNKCFNTLGTCGSVDDYTPSTLTLRFCNNQKNQPEDFLYFPFLQNVKIKGAVINPGSANKSVTALGKRATINATFSDHPGTDRYVDNYLAERKTGAAQYDGVGYEPITRSTFWRKWRARNLYYLFRNMRYISGYINQDGEVEDSITQSFVITGLKGPDNSGKVTIEGKDILTLAQTDKAEAPRASSGKVQIAINDIVTSVTLSPAGIGDIEYNTSGFVRIGEEVCSYTRVADVLTIVRGVRNTPAAAHDAGDTIQECLEYAAQLPYEILLDLLNNFSNISLDYLDVAQWIEESVTNAYLPLAYTTLITEPTPVQKLISEMTEQMYFYTWFDTRTNLVKIRAVRPIGEDEVIQLDYSSNIIADSVKVTDKPDQIITRVVINYAMYNPAKDLDEASNYRVSDVYVNLDLEGTNKNRSSSTKTIYSRWLTNAAGAAADELGSKLIARYQVPPEEITFSLDAKDRDLWTGDFAQLGTPFNVDSVGNEKPMNVQVMEAEETQQGTTYSYVAQSFKFEEEPATNEKTLRISADEPDLNLRDWYDSQYPVTPPLSGDFITFIVDENVTIYSSSVANAALESGSWPAGVELKLEIAFSSFVVGKGGKGADGDNDNGAAGQAGGVGMEITYPISIQNSGHIAGGGGGGGAGAGEVGSFGSYHGGGGGGGGAGFGLGGVVGTNTAGSGSQYQITKNGLPGSTTLTVFGQTPTPGAYQGFTSWSYVYYYDNQLIYSGGKGGSGGAMGQPGQAGQSLTRQLKHLYTPDEAVVTVHTGGAGGAAGSAVIGASNITWLSLGIVSGAIIP